MATTPQIPDTDNKDHTQLLQDAGMMVLMGDIDAETVKPVIEWLLVANHVHKKKSKELLLLINSDGGCMEDAFALVDVMNSSTIPIKTVGLGSVASSGLIIFLAGNTRILTPNTSILSHQYTWGYDTGAKHHELFAIQKEFDLAFSRMMRHYKECTGLDEETIKAKLLPPHDVYLTAEEALQLNICDFISDLRKK